ncbi:MAG TPA: YCF48-related protein [Bacteroidales bacterium]
MKKTLLSLAFIMVAYLSNAQWIEQNSGSTHWFNSISFVDVNTGWICGISSDPLLIHTTDGGANWIPQDLPISVFYGEVTFLDANNGWACGQNGTLLKSTDGGESWSQLTIDMTGTLQSVFFADESNGWCVGQGGKIFHSADGGDTWVLQNSGSDKYLIRTRFLNNMVGWATGIQGTVLYTNDGGETWVTQASNTGFDVTSISIIDENNVWLGSVLGGGGKNAAFDNGAVLHTSDAGTTWEVQYTSTEQVNTVSFVSLEKGWFFGSNGTIMNTVDGGVTWETQYTGVSNIFAIGQMVDELNGWCTGQDGIIMHNSNAVGINDFESSQAGIQISNSPNPFYGNTKINFSIAENSTVEVAVYDVIGKQVAVLLNEEMQAGNHSIDWDASSLAGGIYFCTLKSGNETVTKKMISK